MALVEIQTLKDLGKQVGIQESPNLMAFLRDERARAREDRQADNRAREQQQETYNRARVEQQEHIIGLENSNRTQIIGLENNNG